MKTILCALALALLTACGGGGDDEPNPQKFVGPPDCKARPELCR